MISKIIVNKFLVKDRIMRYKRFGFSLVIKETIQFSVIKYIHSYGLINDRVQIPTNLMKKHIKYINNRSIYLSTLGMKGGYINCTHDLLLTLFAGVCGDLSSSSILHNEFVAGFERNNQVIIFSNQRNIQTKKNSIIPKFKKAALYKNRI